MKILVSENCFNYADDVGKIVCEILFRKRVLSTCFSHRPQNEKDMEKSALGPPKKALSVR